MRISDWSSDVCSSDLAMELNADGQRLLDNIAPALDVLTMAVEEVQKDSNQLRLRLSVLPLFASQRLFPRMGELRRQHPNLHLDVETTPHSISRLGEGLDAAIVLAQDRSEEHTSELQSLMRISYAVFCLKKKII